MTFSSPTSSTLSNWRTPAIILACGCAVLVISMGLRATPGIFLKPMTQANGWSREVFSFAIALQNLMWGLASPFFGAVADRYGAGRTVVTGAILYVLGLSWMAFSQTAADLTMSAGIVVALGISGTATGVVMSVMARARRPFPSFLKNTNSKPVRSPGASRKPPMPCGRSAPGTPTCRLRRTMEANRPRRSWP